MNCILINWQVDASTKPRLLDLVKKLNHRAKVIESSYGKVDVKQIVNTGMFNLQVAQAGYGWLQDLHDMTVREVNAHITANNILPILTGTGQWTQCSYTQARNGRVLCQELHLYSSQTLPP